MNDFLKIEDFESSDFSINYREAELVSNCIIYHYDEFDRIVYLKNPVLSGDFEEIGESEKKGKGSIEKQKNESGAFIYDSVRRAKKMIKNIALLNDWDYFITLTIDPKKYDSTDPKEVMKLVKKYLRHKVERLKMKYMLIPEYHKEGGKIHVHMLLNSNDHDLKLEKAVNEKTGKLIKSSFGHQVYNLKDWKCGYSTACKMDKNKSRVANYVSKYVVKDIKMIFGNYYLHSKGLILEPKSFRTIGVIKRF